MRTTAAQPLRPRPSSLITATNSMKDRNEAVYTVLNTGGTGFRCAGDLDGYGQIQVPDLLDFLED
ncbi:MAG: hypothetical protein HOO04_01430 [Phycisphaerae bacterium]|nr:hypothetical protein [Phycisphaerae bacterium]